MEKAGAHHPNAADTEQVIRYYDALAVAYEADRFGNSYGRYVDAQEQRILRGWLTPVRNGLVLDLACGTGRLLHLATHGLDASPEMVRLARQNHSGKDLRHGLAGNLEEFEVQFGAIFCMHLFMHLLSGEIQTVLNACFNQLKAGGLLIFDVPSASRRKLTGFRPAGWHAGTAVALPDLVAMIGAKWRLTSKRGILFFPIHHLPGRLRPLLRPLDDFIGTTPLKRFSSYLLFRLERK
jgi:SAM-dependent methyltransferase